MVFSLWNFSQRSLPPGMHAPSHLPGLFCVTRIRQKWWRVTCEINYKKLWPLPCFLSWTTCPGGSQLPCGEGSQWLTERSCCTELKLSTSWRRTETCCQQLSWISLLGSRFHSPGQPFGWLQPCLTPWLEPCETLTQGTSSKLLLDSWPSKTVQDSKHLLL